MVAIYKWYLNLHFKKSKIISCSVITQLAILSLYAVSGIVVRPSGSEISILQSLVLTQI